MLSVFMTTIYSQLCGIGIVTAYLIDIFEDSINALTLVLVSRIDYHQKVLYVSPRDPSIPSHH